MANTSLWSSVKKELNFFRIHILFFTFTPLISASIFYAANGENHISFIDSLFNCVSACVVCGLATIDLSLLTGFQQGLMFFLMCIGNPVIVSWVIVYIRRRYFALHCEHIILDAMAKKEESGIGRRTLTIRRTLSRALSIPLHSRKRFGVSEAQKSNAAERQESKSSSEVAKKKRRGVFSKKALKKLRTDMIRRVDDAPKLVDPNGYITGESDGQRAFTPLRTPTRTPTPALSSRSRSLTPAIEREVPKEDVNLTGSTLRDSVFNAEQQQIAEVFSDASATTSDEIQLDGITEHESSDETRPLPSATALHRSATLNRTSTQGGLSRGVPLGHTLTVEFITPEVERGRAERSELRGRRGSSAAPMENEKGLFTNANNSEYGRSQTRTSMSRRQSVSDRDAEAIVHDDRYLSPGTTAGAPLGHRTATMHTHRTAGAKSALHTGYGGFPMPQVLLFNLIKKLFPNFQQRFIRTVTLPRTQTFTAFPNSVTQHTYQTSNTREAPYFRFEAIVGRNSKFHKLTEENLEELGGVEYRALSALLWLVGGYYLGVLLLAYTVIAPYMSMPRWRSDFEPPNLHRFVPPAWFSAFQVVSAFTNTGMSLVDQSMVPFQRAYPMVLIMALLILSGNTAFPIFLRLTIWTISKLVPASSRLKETLQFLLDHPRRCFIYLFPSHQTWFLLLVLVALNATDWFFFLVLDIGNPTIDSIPVGVRFAIGLLQATAVRAAGFATVTISALAPAVQALYVMMMYISVYPIAMSVRSTNVYEEKSLGVYDEEDSDDDSEEEPDEGQFLTAAKENKRVAVWGRYLAWHARRQLAFDMWWLGLALFLVCIIERSKLQDENNFQWFTIFAIIFELISAYGGVGLSLGVPYGNFSFSGAFTPLSKLIVCAVMLRGRHRGLPVAIDRAVLLPHEYRSLKKQEKGETSDLSDNRPEHETNLRRTATQSQPNEKPPANANETSSDDQ